MEVPLWVSCRGSGLLGVVLQIMIIDVVFSLDSVITAVGIAKELWVMATAITAAILVMMLFAKSVGDFVMRYPSVQILALSFLLLIGVLLVADGFGQHVSKGYVYFAMGFSLLVELFNMGNEASARLLVRLQYHGLDGVPTLASVDPHHSRAVEAQVPQESVLV